MKKVLLGFYLAIGLIGCTATTTISKPQVTTSGFDGAKHIEVDPHGVACTQMQCIGIGGIWVSNQPNWIGLNVQIFNDITAIDSVSLNIDGKRIDLNSSKLTKFEHSGYIKSSNKVFIYDLSILNDILQSKRTWIRVYTSQGIVEDSVISDGVDSKAFNALKALNEKIQDAKSK